MGKYTISSTATITSGISGAMDVIKNISIRVYVKKTGTFLTLSYIDNYNDESNGWPSLVLPYPRADFTMTLSTTNVILIAGGIFSSFPPTFTYSDSPLNTVYSGSSLSNADLLYLTNTGAEAFKPKGGMNVARAGHTATLLGTGDILVAGGTDSAGTILSSAETYNAPSGAFSLCPNPMKAPRSNACAVPLTDGNALIAGGYSTGVAPTSSAEVYTTATGKFNFTSSMALPRAGAAAVRLNDGSVLMVGGIQTTGVYTRQAEVYTYPAGVFTLVGALAEPRYQPTATLLDDGTVLVCGGYTGNSHHPLTAEIYNPATHAFTPTTGAPIHSRFGSTATLLPTGQVLIAGGIIDSALGPIITDSAELYNPLNKTFYPLEGFVGQASYNVVDGAANVQVGYVLRNMIYPTVGHRAIRGGPIPPDWVLIVGGFSGWSYLESTQTFILSFDLEEIKNSYVEGPIIRKTHQ